jgi:ABC-2 type transport system permease protein
MAVYKKTYRPYEGPLTHSWSRFLVIRRYAFEDLRQSRFLTIFYIASFLYPLIAALIIWVEHNASALKLLNLGSAARLVNLDSGFFMTVLGWQSMLGLFLAAFVGPGQISPDLSNHALSLYLARPFSRTEYVLGKLSVLFTLLSLMTWVPGLLLFGLQGYLEGWDWMAAHMRVVTGTFFGAWIWILVISLLALALSAWVKWKPAAGALLFGIFFVASGFGGAINAVQETKWGYLLNISNLIGSVWVQLFEGSDPTNNGAVFFRVAPGQEIPVWCCWAMLLLVCLVCLYMLSRKIRGAEVVR